MSIQAISSISNKNHISFSGKKNKQQRSIEPQKTSVLKAVPLAVLLAMSPSMVSQNNRQADLNILYSKEFKSQGWPTAKINYISDDGKNVDRVQLEYEENQIASTLAKDSKGNLRSLPGQYTTHKYYDVGALKQCELIFKDFDDNELYRDTSYFVVGNLLKVTDAAEINDKNYRPVCRQNITEIKNTQKTIDKDLFNYLANEFDGQIPIVIEKQER